MRYVDFGRTGIKVSQFALGTGLLGMRSDRTIDTQEAARVLAAYVEAGGNLIDTSNAYGGGRSEEMIGDFLPAHRQGVVLASKYTRSTEQNAPVASTGNHRKAMRQAVEGSLRRLRTDFLDVYFVHYDDGLTPVEEIMRGFDDLVTAGKILYPGLSNFPAWRTAQAATTATLRGWAPLASVEVEYSLLQRSTEREILPLARDAGLGVLGYSALAAGALTGKKGGSGADPKAASRMGLAGEADHRRVLDAVRDVAAESGIAMSSVALAWVCRKGVIPVLGVRDETQLSGNLAALGAEISSENEKRLDEASAIPLGYPGDLLQLLRR